jgi:hypothetical protein
MLSVRLNRFCTQGALVLAAILPLAQAAAAQETIALAIEGWRQEEGQDGVVYYRCASQICAAGSVVSYKVQPHRPALTIEDFETHHRGLAKANMGSGRIRDVRIVEPMARTIEGVRVLQVRREVDWADGTTTFSIEARLIGNDRSFSLVSDSPKREWTAKNFDGFLRALINIAGINRR